VAALAGECVKLVYANGFSSCAVTETGALYTWAGQHCHSHLGHIVQGTVHSVPRRVQGLCGFKIAAVAIHNHGLVGHTLAADEHGMVFAIGDLTALGLGGPDADPAIAGATDPSLPFPVLDVRALTLKSPRVVSYRSSS